MNLLSGTGAMAFKISTRFVWLLLLSACLTPVDFSTQNAGGKLVVGGQVSNIKDQNYIQVGRTADTERLPFPYSGAAITLFDDAGGAFAYHEDPERIGTYIPPDDFVSINGATYHIQLVAEGKTYESAPEKMPGDAGQIVTNYQFENKEYTDLEGLITYQNFVNIYASAALPPSEEPRYLKWGIEEAFLLSPTDFPDIFGSIPPPCFVVQNADPQKIVLLSSDELNTGSFDNLLIGSRILDWSFLERHYFTTYQSSLTKEAFEYWRKVNILANQVGSIFDTPPAKLRGNISNIHDSEEDVFGYFQAINQSYTRFFMLKADLPFTPTNINCTFDNRNLNEYPSRCLDCLTVPNASYKRPDFF